MKGTVKRWMPLVVWLAVIFALPNALNLISGGGPDLPKRFDKLVHFVEYGVLAVLLHRGLSLPLAGSRALLFSAVASAGLAVGAMDEFTQYFLPLRDSSILDWAADAAGVFAGAAVTALRAGRERREIEER